MGESRFLITYPELRVVALANELDVVPVDIGFEVRCAETAKISITLDGENKMLMRVIVNGGEDKDLFNMDSEAHNCISQLVKVVRKFNVLLGRIDWCYIEYIWTPCGFRYAIYDANSKYVFCIKQDSSTSETFIVLDSENKKKYEIKVQENNHLKITPIERVGKKVMLNNSEIEMILTEKLLLVCATVFINKRDNEQRIRFCNVNYRPSFKKQTIIICIVLLSLICVCIVSLSSWCWNL
ncbi:uncharacterized protein LOC143074358 [Mytilus galloprovincialis]|uniref:uncharacterized protein LOC143074358 n=1 Tax=Mytilus galloprovincialis TaxID=29158 RepID=UPI003F7BDD5F